MVLWCKRERMSGGLRLSLIMGFMRWCRGIVCLMWWFGMGIIIFLSMILGGLILLGWLVMIILIWVFLLCWWCWVRRWGWWWWILWFFCWGGWWGRICLGCCGIIGIWWVSLWGWFRGVMMWRRVGKGGLYLGEWVCIILWVGMGWIGIVMRGLGRLSWSCRRLGRGVVCLCLRVVWWWVWWSGGWGGVGRCRGGIISIVGRGWRFIGRGGIVSELGKSRRV